MKKILFFIFLLLPLSSLAQSFWIVNLSKHTLSFGLESWCSKLLNKIPPGYTVYFNAEDIHAECSTEIYCQLSIMFDQCEPGAHVRAQVRLYKNNGLQNYRDFPSSPIKLEPGRDAFNLVIVDK